MVWKASLVVLTTLVILVLVARTASVPLRVERTFHAPPETVWKYWNDPDSMKRWWGPKDFTAPFIQNDPRVGGKVLLSMKHGDGELQYNVGTYSEVVPMQRMVSAMSFSDAQGTAIPGPDVKLPGSWPDAVTVCVTFQAIQGGKTRVVVTETGMPLIIELFAGLAWKQQFDKFEQLL